MKKLAMLVIPLVIATCLVAGCGGGTKTYTDPGQVISTGVNQEFVIALGSNPTTGYMWQAGYDETILELGEKTFELGAEAEQGVVGAGGVEYFPFQALKAGETSITMSYQRPWETEVIDEKVFTVKIK